MTDMLETLRNCDEIINDVNFSRVRKWKDERPGSHVIGYFPVYAPIELIDAAGMLPVALNGAGDQLDIQHADARFGSFICSIIKTTLELGLTNHLDTFDAILFSSICDSARNLCFVMKRNFPAIYTDFLHLPQNPSSEGSIPFLVSEYARLKVKLEEMSGRTIDNDAILLATEKRNANRDLMRKLYAIRDASPHLLPTSELYALVRAGNFLPVEEHDQILNEALEEIPKRNRKMRDCIRIVVEGSFCEQPPIDLIKLIENAGCYVVDDDFDLGRRWFTEDIPIDGDPMYALAESYLNRSVYSSVRHDFRKPRHEELVKKARASRADAVISLIAKFCEPAYFDFVLFKRELEAAEIPHLLLEFEEKMFTFDRLQTEVETFVESLLFK